MIVVVILKIVWNGIKKMWNYTVELFRTLDIPVRTLENVVLVMYGFKI